MGKSLKGKELGKGITQRKDGNYQARFIDSFGKVSYVYADCLSDIYKKLDEAKFCSENMSLVKNPSITLDSWYAQWMQIYGVRLRDSTRHQYNKMYDKVKDDIGHYKLKDINLNIVQKALNGLPSDAYRQRVRTMLLALFERALDNDYVLKNPVKATVWKIDNAPKQDKTPMNVEQEKLFLEHIYKPRVKHEKIEHVELIEFMLRTGMRLGEATGLTWDDIDFDNCIIHVRKNLVTTLGMEVDGTRKKRHPRFHKPKTESSYRKVPMTERVREILLYEKQRDELIAKKYPPLEGFEELVFVSWLNKPIYDDVVRRILRKFTMELRELYDVSFPNVSPHILRHTFATRCVEKGMNLKVLQSILGHADFETTMNTYTHTTDDVLVNEMFKCAN